MDARKPDPATQSGDRIETRPPEDIFSSLPPEAPVPDGQPRKRSLFARIRQVFVADNIFTLGQVEQVHEGTSIRIYNKERMLIELLRYKDKLPYDYYKEILRHYREIIERLDIEQVQEYAAIFPKSEILWKRLDEEVF